VEGLKQLNYKGKPNRLMEKKAEIIPMLEADPPATYKEAQAKIKRRRAWNVPAASARVSKKEQDIRRKVKQFLPKPILKPRKASKLAPWNRLWSRPG